MYAIAFMLTVAFAVAVPTAIVWHVATGRRSRVLNTGLRVAARALAPKDRDQFAHR